MQKFSFSVSLLILWGLFCANTLGAGLTPRQEEAPIYTTKRGQIAMRSTAPLEVIDATSSSLRGVLDASKQTFAFSVPIRSFDGFNNPLQKEHFNENYLESSRYPNAQFTGKIIEPIPLGKEGAIVVRAKGILDIHGIKRERIIPVSLQISAQRFTLESYFTVMLEDHNISVPKIVTQKVAREIEIRVEATMQPLTDSE